MLLGHLTGSADLVLGFSEKNEAETQSTGRIQPGKAGQEEPSCSSIY